MLHNIIQEYFYFILFIRNVYFFFLQNQINKTLRLQYHAEEMFQVIFVSIIPNIRYESPDYDGCLIFV